jgi:hypothetical protein
MYPARVAMGERFADLPISRVHPMRQGENIADISVLIRRMMPEQATTSRLDEGGQYDCQC